MKRSLMWLLVRPNTISSDGEIVHGPGEVAYPMHTVLFDAFEKLFPVQRHEWPKALTLLSVATLIGVGANISRAASEGMFLIHLGVDYLPYVLLANPILVLVTSTMYTAYADRIPDDCLMMYTSLLPVPWIVL